MVYCIFMFMFCDQSALGWDYQANLAKHGSQTDAAKGFGGKYGVQETKDKVLMISVLIVINILIFSITVM